MTRAEHLLKAAVVGFDRALTTKDPQKRIASIRNVLSCIRDSAAEEVRAEMRKRAEALPDVPAKWAILEILPP